MKVLVEIEIPKTCEECPFCHTFVNTDENGNKIYDSAICVFTDYSNAKRLQYSDICKGVSEFCKLTGGNT